MADVLPRLYDRRDQNQQCIVTKALIRNLLCARTADSSDVYAIELTAPQSSDLRVGHGHGAENADETKL